MRLPAVKFRRKIYVAGPRHQDAINLAFEGMSKLSVRNTYLRISSGKENIIFGFAFIDGHDWIECDMQRVRKLMYGFG